MPKFCGKNSNHRKGNNLIKPTNKNLRNSRRKRLNTRNNTGKLKEKRRRRKKKKRFQNLRKKRGQNQTNPRPKLKNVHHQRRSPSPKTKSRKKSPKESPQSQRRLNKRPNDSFSHKLFDKISNITTSILKPCSQITSLCFDFLCYFGGWAGWFSLTAIWWVSQ